MVQRVKPTARHFSIGVSEIVIIIALLLLSRVVKGDSLQTASEQFSITHSSNMRRNASSCAECHNAPLRGGSSKVTVTRAGYRVRGRYEGVGETGTIQTQGAITQVSASMTGLRVALNILGDGYIEAVPDQEIKDISAKQQRDTHRVIHGEYTSVTLPDSPLAHKVVGRFGWKAQHGSLLSASAEAMFSELGVSNQLFPMKATKIAPADLAPIVKFLEASSPIAPDAERAASESSQLGHSIFDKIGCGICHVESLKTGREGEQISGSLVPRSLADVTIHPYTDLLLHDVGTGDGITENIRTQDYDEATANKFRTAPLWGVRYRSWLMHDGKSITYHQAIMRHGGEAQGVVNKYLNLNPVDKEQLLQFLDSL